MRIFKTPAGRSAAVALILSTVLSVCGLGAAVAVSPSSRDQVWTSAIARPTATITKTVTATVTATVTQTVTATATVTQTVTSEPSATPTPTPTETTTPTPTETPTSTITPTPTEPPSDGFPDETNTGIPAGTVLTPYSSCTITSTVTLTARSFDCPNDLLIRAPGVVITDSLINGHVVIDTDLNQSWSLTLTDSEVAANAGDLPAIYNGNFIGLRLNIHGGHNGLECQEHSSRCSLKDSYIHDQWQSSTGETHLGGFLDLGSVVPCTGPDANGVPACVDLTHNRITCDAPVNPDGGGCTGDINLINHFGPLHGALIVNNFLGANAGAAFCTYGSAGFEYPADHIVYRDNVFERTAEAPRCADYGPVTNFDSNALGNVWSNNTWIDGGTVDPAN